MAFHRAVTPGNTSFVPKDIHLSSLSDAILLNTPLPKDEEQLGGAIWMTRSATGH